MVSKNIFLTKADYETFKTWVKQEGWLFIKREGIWSATDEPTFLYWLETWLTPAGNIVKIDTEGK